LCIFCVLFISRLRPARRSTLFPYTTLFRSWRLLPLIAVDDLDPIGDVVFDFLRQDAFEAFFFLFGMGDDFADAPEFQRADGSHIDRKSTRLNSSHVKISYAVFCLKKKKETT